MIKKFIARLVTNFQPRMNLGEKRFNEERDATREASNYNKEIAAQREQERLRDHMKKRKEPSEAEILGPSNSVEKKED